MAKIPRRRLAAVLAVAWGSACGDLAGPLSRTVVDLSRDWELASPESAGIDPDVLEAAARHAGSLDRVLSLLVVRYGRLVFEGYYRGNHRDSLNDVRSVTKSVLSSLVAVAVEQGFLESTGATVGQLLPPGIAELDSVQASISILDLLRMAGGFEWNEQGAVGYNQWITSSDHLAFLLEKPIVEPPGTVFQYNSAATHLLGVLLTQTTGMSTPDFADRYLFEPLGIVRREWEIISRGYANGGAGIDLRPRDLAKLGALWLQDGYSAQQRLFPATWVSEATTPQFGWSSSAGPVRQLSYGYLWWLERAEPAAFFAWGHGGQFVYVVPSLDLVVVVTTEWRGAGSDAGRLAEQGLELIIDYVLAAIVE